MVTRRYAVVLVAVLALVYALAAWGARPEREPDRQLGFGQVRFNGLGPERWAQRWRQEHRRALALHRALVRHVDRIAGVVSGLLCIHDYEGSWSDSGAPYWGGLQMDERFMAAYGGGLLRRKGTADHWTVGEQLAAGIEGYMARGWEPWPNTSRRCGLR